MKTTLLILTVAFSSIAGEPIDSKNSREDQRDKKCTYINIYSRKINKK